MNTVEKVKRGRSHGEPFDGPMEAFGRLCFYKWSANQHPAAPNTLPGLFVGWRLENGMKYKGVCFVLDFAQAQSEGITQNSHIRSIPAKEILFPAKIVYPFAEAACQHQDNVTPTSDAAF